MKDYVAAEIAAHGETYRRTEAEIQDAIVAAASAVADCIKAGGKVLICGNGGSAADAQHIAAELVGRFVAKRDGLACLALSTDTSALTSIGNDFGFDHIFARQVQALATTGDLLIGISTSGKSPNVIKAFEEAKRIGCKTVGWLGKGGGPMAEMCDHAVIVPSDDTQRIQEMHILIGHITCGIVERTITSQ